MHGRIAHRPPASLIVFTVAWVLALVGFAFLVMQMPQGTAPSGAGSNAPVSDVSR